MANSSGWRLRHSLTATSVALGMVLASTTPSCAVDLDGSTSNNWFNAGNWSGGVPTNATNTRIDTITPNATVVGAAGAQSTGLRVGVSATGALTIQSGGTVSNTLGIIGDNAGSTGTVIVDGAGSTWTNSNSLDIGSDGNGTLTIRNGGAVSSRQRLSSATIRRDRRGNGRRRRLDLDHQRISISAGTAKRHAEHQQRRHGEQRLRLYRLAATGSTGTVTVDGAGSTWTNGAAPPRRRLPAPAR